MSTDSQAVIRTSSSSVGFVRFCQSTLLLLIRIYFFWQLFKIGLAKLENIATPIGFFTKLGIPFPEINAWIVGCTECFGGVLIVAGLASRLAAIPVTISMALAYWLGDRNAVLNIWGHPDKFISAAPFPFFLAALIVLCFGPGWFSLDAIFGRLFRRKPEE
ncbi:MAG: DoxX family protein [Verrucomicrobia bacterium]|nr:DoxX family protein [Verrucomicrobiota bacterium]